MNLLGQASAAPRHRGHVTKAPLRGSPEAVGLSAFAASARLVSRWHGLRALRDVTGGDAEQRRQPTKRVVVREQCPRCAEQGTGTLVKQGQSVTRRGGAGVGWPGQARRGS
jgi:hypothetical protein